MTDLLEQVVLTLYEGRKKKDASAEGEEKEVEVTKRVPSEKSPYGKIEKGKIKIRSDKSMGSTYGGKASSQSKAAAAAAGKEAKDKENPKGPKSGYDKVASAERAKRAVTGDAEAKAMADAKKELAASEERKKAHKKAELKAARRAAWSDYHRTARAEKERNKKATERAERKARFKKNTKKQGDE